MMWKVSQFLFSTIPRIKTKLQLSAFVISAALVILISIKHSDAVIAQVAIGGIALVIVVFAQIFNYIKDFPEDKRGQLIVGLFSMSCFFILVLLGIVVYGLRTIPHDTKTTPGVAADSVRERQASPGLSFDILLNKGLSDHARDVAIKEGDTIRGNRKDGYRIAVLPQNQQYIYIFQVDSKGKLNWVFPWNPGDTFSRRVGTNPVSANQLVIVPEKSWFLLDNDTGYETVFVAGSNDRWTALEQLLDKTLSNQEVSRIAEDTLRLKGIGTIAIPSDKQIKVEGENTFVKFTTFFKGNDSVVVTRKSFFHGD